MNILLVIIVCVVGETGGPSTPLSFEPIRMPTLTGTESAMVDTVRVFDLEQQALAEAELSRSYQYQQSGKTDLALQQIKQAEQRYQHIALSYEELLRNYPNNGRAMNYYGELLYDHLGEILKAIQYWKLATFADPTLGTPWNNLAIYYFHNGEYKLGYSHLSNAIKLEPDNPDFLYNMAQMYLLYIPFFENTYGWSSEKIYKMAMKLSKKAASLAPDDFELQRDYALNFFAGESFGVKVSWKKAAEAWRQARTVEHTTDEVFNPWLYEGRAWLRAKKYDAAKACFIQALELRPDSPVAQQLLEIAQTSN